MRSFFITLIFFLAVDFSFGQSIPDSTNNEMRPRRDLVFTRAEIMPEYKFGLRALADSIKKSLMQEGFEFSPARISVVLTVSKYGDVTDVQISANKKNSQADLIKKSLEATTGMWIPAKQNEHVVPCYKKLLLHFSKNDLKISNYK